MTYSQWRYRRLNELTPFVVGGPKTHLERISATAPSEGVSKWQDNDALPEALHAHGTPSTRHQSKAVYFQEPSMPVGEACREDGTLKDASEMTWLNSPSDENRRLESNEKRSPTGSSELEWPDSPSESANVRSKRKCDYDESGLNSEDDQPYRAKVSETYNLFQLSYLCEQGKAEIA